MKNSFLKSLSQTQGKIIIAIIVAVLLIPVLILVINFRNHPLSDKIADWGTFGDYLGGTIGAIINLTNLVFLIYITYKLSDIDANREKDNLKYQSLISLNELRNQEFKEVNQTLKLFTSETIMGDSKSFAKCALYATEVEAFCEGMSHLFPFLNNASNYESLIASMQVLLENIRLRQGEPSNEQKAKYRQDTNIFVSEKDDFLKNLQLDIISHNPLKLIQNERT